MICPTCRGTGEIANRLPQANGAAVTPRLGPEPCPECAGSGFAYCCEPSQRTQEKGHARASQVQYLGMEKDNAD